MKRKSARPSASKRSRALVAHAIPRRWRAAALAAFALLSYLLATRSSARHAGQPTATVERSAPFPTPSPSATPSSSLAAQATVVRVVDGDTVKLDNGETVRYIGIDTPEMRRHDGARWVKDPQPFAIEATDANRRLVEGKLVRLEYDVQPRDRYGRALAYVYVDRVMINAKLIEDGNAQPLTVPPNVKHAEEFRALAAAARQAGRGLWALGDPPSRRRKSAR